jgi:hypothetical protein
MKQTAVEYLVNQFRDAIGDSIINVMTDEINQAKEIEKQQIIDAHNDGHRYYEEGGLYAEEYYNETFNK